MVRPPGAALRLLVFVANLALLPSAVLVNAGPAEYAEDGYGGTLVPVRNDAIVALGERLTIDFSKADAAQGRSLVPVRATYRIRNESSSPQSALLAFPYWTWRQEGDALPEDESAFRVTLDGVPLPTRAAAMDLPDESAPAGGGLLRDLRTRAGEGGQSLREFSWPWALRATAFEIGLPPGAERALEVSYRQDAGVSLHESPWHQLVQLDYVLSTARYWKGFHDLEVEVLVPRGARVEASLPFAAAERQGVDSYVFRSPSLPDANLRVGVALPLPAHVVFLRFVGGGSADTGRTRLAALPAVIVPVAVWVAVARRASRDVGHRLPRRTRQ